MITIDFMEEREMPKGDKFVALTEYLEECGEDIIKMSFSEIEKKIGFRLSDSAYVYPAQWANSESQSLALGWLNAGYLTRQVNIQERTVEFIKRETINTINGDGKLKRELKSNVVTLPTAEAIRCIRAYFNDTVKDSHGRYLSWQHCYKEFVKYREKFDDDILDYLSLHLAFYLASWGMYRGSSFLLQKDYKVHVPVVKIIMEEKYNPLMGITAEELIKEQNLNLLVEIAARIRETYASEPPSFEGTINNATDTLVTKILLGTLGCVPAYDRYYVSAVKKYGISKGIFNRDSVRDVAQYYLLYREDFEKLRAELSTQEIEYPVMKLMDMCMWQIAFEVDK